VSPRVVREERLLEQIRRVHHAHYGIYGAFEGVVAVASGRHRCCPLHGRTVDA
jgi:hypothetical protein